MLFSVFWILFSLATIAGLWLLGPVFWLGCLLMVLGTWRHWPRWGAA